MSLNEISTKKANGIFWVIIGLLALGGAALLWYSTPFGMALVNDSVNYIDGARNLLAGHGYSRILGNGNYASVTNFPPFYSVILAGILILGVDGITATWWLGVVFYALNLMLVGWLGRKITGSSVFGILSVVLFLLSEPFLNFHTFALTEPIFLFNFFLTIIFAILFLEKQKWYWIVLSGFFASLTYLTRYIGASLFVTVIASIIVFMPGWRKKLQYGLLFLAGALPAVIAWTVRNIIQTGNATNRQTLWHAIPVEKAREGVLNFWNWLLPERYNLIERGFEVWRVLLYLGLIVFLLGFAYVTVRYWMKKTKPYTRNHAIWVIAMQALIYFLLLVITLVLLDASVNFEPRILMPIYNMLLFLIVALLHWLWNRPRKIFKFMAFFIVFALMLSFVEDTMDTIKSLRSQGQGFANESWTESQTIAEINKYPDFIIYTNRPRAINLFLNRGAYILPSQLNPSTGEPWQNYQKDVDAIRKSVFDGKAILVVFDYQNVITDSEGQAWMEDLTAGLPVFSEFPDGMIFGVKK